MDFHQVLQIIAWTLAFSIAIGSSGPLYVAYILLPCMLVVLVAAIVARRGMRKYLRRHGEVEIRTTFSIQENRPRKNVLYREVAELIDDGIDRVLDGKREDGSGPT